MSINKSLERNKLRFDVLFDICYKLFTKYRFNSWPVVCALISFWLLWYCRFGSSKRWTLMNRALRKMLRFLYCARVKPTVICVFFYRALYYILFSCVIRNIDIVPARWNYTCFSVTMYRLQLAYFIFRDRD